VLRQQINHAAQALERCQGNGVQRPLVCLGTRQGLGGDQGWGLAEVCAAAMHRLKLLGSLREELGVGASYPGAENLRELDSWKDGYGGGSPCSCYSSEQRRQAKQEDSLSQTTHVKRIGLPLRSNNHPSRAFPVTC
jgi:hypothetical protein